MSDTFQTFISGSKIEKEPYYLPVKNEIEIFDLSYQSRLPVMIKGPTGCGKTRFIEYMAFRLNLPLITVACHEDMTAGDLVGRFLFKNDETIWVDGPLTTAVRHGAICYLDEIVEARKDTTVIIHPLTDNRRILPIEKKDELLKAHDDFMLVISYNPGYQSILKDLKQSTKQRFVALNFDYPPESHEVQIVSRETKINSDDAQRLVRLGRKIRQIKDFGLSEGVSTRLLIYAGYLIKGGLSQRDACEVALCQPITDDKSITQAISELISDIF
ncbi:MAG: CbbQ/NirQ/NorQ/GpvN family protein [Proteobacteria bacterium]|nr:CbbQ/NirQ/NorQ/GpvN family protein [Pseudomonadota bacterium]